MRFRLLVTLLALLSALGLQAGKRTKNEMKAAALGVLSQNSASRAAVAVSSTSDLKEYLTTEQLSVIGSDDLGFAVVTTDDHVRPVIGYSTTLFTETMPDGFKWWLEKAEAALLTLHVARGTLNDNSLPQNVQRSTFNVQRKSVAPLMTTKWGQEFPYNAKLRYNIGDNTYQFMTGCVATAMAQVMNYHRFPRRGHGSVRYVLRNYQTWIAHTFTDSYNWDVMQDTYSSYQSEGGSDETVQAISTLMRDCGMSVKMNYDYAVSLANTDDIVPALTEYFSYDESGTRQVRRADYSDEEWMQLIYDELSAGRPVIYSGINRSNPDKTYGHTFVVHGCDADGLVYVNWGWRGQHDGFFDIDLLSANGSSFNDDQDMILVKPGTHDRCAVKVIATGAGKVHLGDATNAVTDTTKVYKVDEGASLTLIAIPDDGWRISHVFVGQDEVTAQVKDGQYTLESVDDNMTLSVTFEQIPIFYYTMRITTKGGGRVAYGTRELKDGTVDFSVLRDSSVLLTVTPDEGWVVSRLTVNGSDVLPELENGTVLIGGIKENVDVSVAFTKATYQLTYMVDGAMYKTLELEYEAEVIPETEPVKEGFAFSGWMDVPSAMPAHDVVVTGSFAANQYKLTYLVDGHFYKDYNFAFGSSLMPEPLPEKEGCRFVGWSWMPHQMPSEDVMVMGVFLPNNYTVTYMVDGTVYLTDSVQYNAVLLPPPVPERSGCYLEWEEIPVTMPAADIVVNGIYTTGFDGVPTGKAALIIDADRWLLSGLQPGESVRIYSLTGELVKAYQASSQGDLAIPLSQLSPALYIIRANQVAFEIARK